jgi:hypothetical protein
MQFVYPQMLWALSLLAVPIIIHLFNFRRYQKIVFSSLRFLTGSTAVNKKQQQLKKWLILFTRLLAFFALVLAFAQPYFPLNNAIKKQAENIVAIYIDNSFSMDAVGTDGIALEVAKNKAAELIQMQAATTKFLLVTNDFEGKHQHLINKEIALQFVSEIKTSYQTKLLSDINARIKQLTNDYTFTQKTAYFISDFQYPFFNLTDYDSLMQYNMVPVKTNWKNNISIDTAYINTPFIQSGKPVTVEAVISNYGNSSVENIPVTLKVNQVHKSLQNANVGSNSKSKIQFTFTLNDTGIANISLHLTDYPITFDDEYFLSVKPNASANVLLLNAQADASAIDKVYGLDAFYHLNLQSVNQINYNQFKNQELIILYQPEEISSGLMSELDKYLQGGGCLLIIPGNASVNSYLNKLGVLLEPTTHTPLQIENINTKDALFNGVFTDVPKIADWPKVFKTNKLNIQTNSNAQVLLQLNNGWPYLVRTNYLNGKIYVLAGGLGISETTLTNHALFVPLMLNMPLTSKRFGKHNYTLENNTQVTLKCDLKESLVTVQHNNKMFVTEAKLVNGKWQINTGNQFNAAGFWEVINKGLTVDFIAVNYLRLESNPQFENEKNINKNITWIADDLKIYEASLKLLENGKTLWFWFLLAAFLMLFAEVFIIRFVK